MHVQRAETFTSDPLSQIKIKVIKEAFKYLFSTCYVIEPIQTQKYEENQKNINLVYHFCRATGDWRLGGKLLTSKSE